MHAPSFPLPQRFCTSIFLSALALLSLTTASPLVAEEIGTSSLIHDPLTNPVPRECPVSQDGATSNTFPWTHAPKCLALVLPSAPESHTGTHRTFCVYTNAEFGGGRGISIVSSVETAMYLPREVWEAGAGDAARDAGEEAKWEARATEGKGVGLFAKREMEAGETVMQKSPVLLVSRELLGSVSHSRRRTLLEKAVEQLPPRTKEMVLKLSRRGGESEVEDIINVNAIRAKVWDGTPHLLVVPEAARINHACRPNAHYRFSDHTLSLTVFALSPISPATELSFSYGFPHLPHDKRIPALRSTWGFTCTCPLCTASASTLSASNTRLADIAAIKASLPTDLKDIPQYIALLPRLVGLLEEEGLRGEFGMYEEILAYAWAAVKEEGRAKAWAERAERSWGIVAGKESWEAKRCSDLARDVKGHPWDEHEHDEHEHEH